MNKLFFVAFLALFLGGCAGQEEVAAFHPTDSDALSTQGGKGFTAEDPSVVQLDSEPVKAFHPTDALLIGGNGPFNAAPDANDIVDLDQNDSYWANYCLANYYLINFNGDHVLKISNDFT